MNKLVQTLRARSGFTLVEVLVSVAILSTGLVLILRAYTTAIVAMDVSDEAVRASLLIDETMGKVTSGLQLDRDSMSMLDGRSVSGDFSIDVDVRSLARLEAISSTVVRVNMTVTRTASGRSYQAASCVTVEDP